MEVAGANRRWRCLFRYRGSRHESAVAQLFSLGHMTMSRLSRVKRFVAVAICATLAVAGMFFIEFFVFPDIRPPTHFEDCFFWVWAVASWPLSIVWSMSQLDPPWVVIILLTIASGLFWAFVVELLF
jgi:hypothetical protein